MGVYLENGETQMNLMTVDFVVASVVCIPSMPTLSAVCWYREDRTLERGRNGVKSARDQKLEVM